MSETSLIPVETKQKLEQAVEFFHSLKEVSFTNDEQYENGLELCKAVKTHIKIIDDDRKNLVKPFNDKVSEINIECNGVIRKLQNAEKVLKEGMGAYYKQKELKRIQEQKRLDAEAEERRRQEVAKAQREAEKSEQYREQGREEMADKAQARAETAASIASTVTAKIVTNTAKAAGTTFKTVYKAEVVNTQEALQYMILNEVLIGYISIDIKGVEKLITAHNGKLSIPGIRIKEDVQVGIRT